MRLFVPTAAHEIELLQYATDSLLGVLRAQRIIMY